MRLASLTPKDGSEKSLESINVLVGPNNAGKTQTLSDIHQLITTKNSRTTVLEGLEYEDVDSLNDLLDPLNITDHPNRADHRRVRDFGSNPNSKGQQNFQPDQVNTWMDHGKIDNILNQVGQFHVFYLDASSRLEIAESGPAHDAQEDAPTTLLQKLYESDESVEEELRSAFRDTFEMEIRFDYSSLKQLCFRIADGFGKIPDDPRESRDIFAEHRKLDDQGHGFKSFVGVVLSLLLSSHRVVLMDEPEAFLHPAQARDLGRWIADHSSQISGQVLLATHDSNFLSGVLEGESEVRILRLNRPTTTETYYNAISPDVTTELAHEPLLSSQRVLESVFHRGVVVCEGGSDRSVYQAVASRILDHGDILFVDALGKDSIKKVTNVIGGAYTPNVAVTDIDILDDHHEFRYLLESLGEDVEFEDVEHILNKRREVEQTLESESISWEEVKDDGIDAIPSPAQETCESIFEDAKEYGHFIVPVGELESWMDLGVSKSRWGPKALDVISQSECDDNLIEFVSEITTHLDSEYSEMIGS
jgi:ABC-type enterochelin transport system ATPase subunit